MPFKIIVYITVSLRVHESFVYNFLTFISIIGENYYQSVQIFISFIICPLTVLIHFLVNAVYFF